MVVDLIVIFVIMDTIINITKIVLNILAIKPHLQISMFVVEMENALHQIIALVIPILMV
jgi:hypothetical protein